MTRFALVLLSFSVLLEGGQAQALDKVRFGTNWVAEAEHGGFYQAVADGTYKKYGLDVTIVPGGPNVNNRILLPVGKLDFFMSANSLQTFDAVEHNIPTVAVAASVTVRVRAVRATAVILDFVMAVSIRLNLERLASAAISFGRARSGKGSKRINAWLPAKAAQ